MTPKWKRGAFASPDGVAIGGYDPVAYFTERRARRGDPSLEAVWSGSKWRFAQISNRDLFMANPERYAPQCGGLCAFAISLSDNPRAPAVPSGSPRLWTVRDGKLYLNNNPFAHIMFRLLRRGGRADEVWAKLSG